MQFKGNETKPAWHVLRFILLSAASALIIGVALTVALVSTLAAGSRQRRGRSKPHPELIVVAAFGIVYALWRKREPKWHACGQCGVPIEPPSRAEYCSPTCRRYARLQREELERRSELLDSFGAVPF
jgi:ribosomal protein L34E